MRNPLPYLIVLVMLAAGCVQSDAPIFEESEAQRGRIVTPGVYLCESCEDAVAVGWDESAMLHVFDGEHVLSKEINGRRLVQIKSGNDYMLFWTAVEEGRRFIMFDLSGDVDPAAQKQYGVDVEHDEEHDFHTLHGESAAIRRFMLEYAPEHMQEAGVYSLVIAADITQKTLEACEDACNEQHGESDYSEMVRGCVARCAAAVQ
ncbi:hypothetical protein [Oceanidesulfovibrio marinus]|uniref:Copper chaperone NosL n=1 Tax=Oceanidesulfovibrio marinus TaxID=370038 RepID=A0ABX6NFA7_9BACT|nr:hypothetical protein [Oceanidesulfovibrio marinus]QJT09268.1 hypothetical protein E8L03_10095 [Oceanidesulfovibrio marinus]